MSDRGERAPREGETGMEMALYLRNEEVGMLDDLKDYWGLKRNTTLRELIRDAHSRLPAAAARRAAAEQ